MPTYVSNDLSRRERQVVFMMAECDLRQAAVARRLDTEPCAIQYNIERIRVKTGLDPRKFYDLQKLLRITEACT